MFLITSLATSSFPVIRNVEKTLIEPVPVSVQEIKIENQNIPTKEEIKNLIREESIKAGINPATSTDIAFYESSFRINVTNKGIDNGLYAFNDETFQEKCIDKYGLAKSLDQKFDYKIQIKCHVKLVSDGQIWRWASSRDKWDPDYAGCNCVVAARLKNPFIPFQDASKFIPNTNIPRLGDVLVMNYDGESHIGIIGGISKIGYNLIGEGNYFKCMIINRIIKFTDTHIVGIWTNKNSI